MGHSYAIDPTTYCRIKSFARSNVFEDSDLIGGNVELWLDWETGPIKPFLGWDAGTTLHGLPIGIGGGTKNWDAAYGGTYTADGAGAISCGTAALGFLQPAGFYSQTPWTRSTIDLSVDVTLGTAGGGLYLRVQDNNQCFAVYFDVPSGHVKVQKRANPTYTVTHTGTATQTTGTHNLRVTIDGSSVFNVYVDGVLDITFTDTDRAAYTGMWYLLTQDATTKLSNVYGAPIGSCPATAYEVIDTYTGEVVASGAVSGHKIVIADSSLNGYGTYKVRLTGASVGDYGAAKGNCTFARVAPADNFADKPPALTAQDLGSTAEWDAHLRSFFGLGAARLGYDVATPSTFTNYMKTNYLDLAHPSRPRYIIGHFSDDNTGDAATITAYVAANKANIGAWEPRNEPQGTAAASFVSEQQYFYNAVKAGDADALVLGPNPVSYNTSSLGITWLTAFLAAGGDAYLDGISVHGYNCVNGDIAMGRRLLAPLQALSDLYGLPLWQTEQSALSPLENLYEGNRPVRWDAAQLMVQEIYGLPVERNVLWYDREHGFARYTCYWLDDQGVAPTPLMVRTMVAELGDRVFASEYDLGEWSDVYLCALWTGTDGTSTLGTLAQSKGMPGIRFYTAATTLVSVDAYGNETTLTPANRIVTVPASDLPTWVRLPAGVTLTLVDDWAEPNLLTAATVTTDASGTTYNLANLVTQKLENQYEYNVGGVAQTNANYICMNTSETFPQTYTASLATAVTASRIGFAAPPPWQTGFSTPTDFDVDVYDGATWTTVHTQEPDDLVTAAFVSDLTSSNTTYDTFFNPAHAWDIRFDSRQVSAVRVVIRDISWGGHQTENDSHAAWGDPPIGAEQWVTLSGLRLYEGDILPGRERFNLTVTCSG